MIKDIEQKQKAARYCVANGIIPYMEVVVRYIADIAEVESNISDIDVLGIRPPSLVAQQRTIFDCKTQNKVSPVNRALWAAGLMRLVAADEGFVILKRAAPEGHRLAANEIGVRLTSETLFDSFGKSSSPNYAEGATYLDCSDAWQKIFELSRVNANLESLVHFLLHSSPLELDSAAGFRSLISKLKRAEGEFDVSKPAHRALWGLVVCEGMRFLSQIAVSFNHVFDPAMERAHFEQLLRNYTWGGKESYAVRQKLHAAIRAPRAGEELPAFELPGWDRYVELMRGLLDAPHLVGSGILPLKDISFKEICDARELADKRIKLEINSNNRARQFLISGNRYLGSLSPHFKDCAEHYSKLLAAL